MKNTMGKRKNKKGEISTRILVKIILLIVIFAIIGTSIIYLLKKFGVF